MTNCLEDIMEKWYTISVNNSSHKKIYISAGYSRYGMPEYPDTLLPTIEPDLYTVDHGEQNKLRSSFEWETVIEKMELDTLSIYFFNADTIENYSWDEIVNGYKIIERRDFSIDDLKQINWSVTYP
jgi:hypothetical protein